MYWSGAMNTCNSSGFGDYSAFQENFHKMSYSLVEHKRKELVIIWQRAVKMVSLCPIWEKDQRNFQLGQNFFLRAPWLKKVERRDDIQADHEFWEDKGITSPWENKIIIVKKEHGHCSSSWSLVLSELEAVSLSTSHWKPGTSKAIHTVHLSYLKVEQHVSKMPLLFFFIL